VRVAIIIVSIVFLMDCCAVRASSNQQGAAQNVSYCDLAKNPSAFSGKRIRVRAIYRYAFEVQRLEPPACCPEAAPKIWVEINAGLEGSSLKLFHKFPKGEGLVLVTFAGTFESGGTYGTFADRHKLTVDQIESVERIARSSRRQDDPPWVPKNCKAPEATQPKSSSAVIHEVLHAEGAVQFLLSQRYAYDAAE